MTQHEDPILQQRRALKAVALTGLVFVLLSLPVFGIVNARSVAAGAAVACFNLWAIGRAVRAFLSNQASFSWGLFVMLKFSLVAAGLYLLFRGGLVQGLPLMLGLGALPIGVSLAQLVAPVGMKEGNSARSQ